MHTPNHYSIFYPSDADELALVSAQRPRLHTTKALSSLPGAILCPHASYPMILDLLHESFSAVNDLTVDLVVILAPLHQEALAVDAPHFLFTPSGKGITVGHAELTYAHTVRQQLLAAFPMALKEEDSYFQEEPAVELTLPLCSSYCKGAEVLPLLTATKDSEQIRLYARMLKHIVSLVPHTLFVVSANLNGILPGPIATEHATELVDLLQEGTPLLRNVQSHQISSCGIAAFEALRHQSWGHTQWSFNKFSVEGTQCTTLPNTYTTKERIVWHASAIRKEV